MKICKIILFIIVLLLSFQLPSNNTAIEYAPKRSLDNLFDKNTATQGYFINDATGKLNYNSDFFASNFISIEPATKYKMTIGYYIAFYFVYCGSKINGRKV